MKTGDAFTDSLGQAWTIDAPLGRGLWCRTWSLRGHGGLHAVLKVPLIAADFGERADAPQLVELAHAAFDATRHLLTERPAPFLPRLLAVRVDTPGVILPRYPIDLESRLQSGLALSELIDLIVRTLHALAHSTADVAVHGNLRPSNILLDDEGRVILSDPRPASLGESWLSLARAHPSRVDYLPPEPQTRPSPGADTWALCQVLYRAAMTPVSGVAGGSGGSSDDPRRGVVIEPPRTGLSRVALAGVKDGAAARLRAENANRRFAARVTEKLGTVLNRGLSAETDPSPPYRFRSAAELLPRLVEVDDLVHPAVDTVSKPLMPNHATDAVFDAGQPVEFAVNVGTTAGITAQDDIACGVQVRDLDTPAHTSGGNEGRVRVPNARFTVKQYPSGRWRFNFTLPDVAPGRYQVRVAFMVKGAEEEAQVAEGQFQVRPTPGYVPPPAPTSDSPTALPLPERPGLSAHRDEEGTEGGESASIIPFPRRHESTATPVRPRDQQDVPDRQPLPEPGAAVGHIPQPHPSPVPMAARPIPVEPADAPPEPASRRPDISLSTLAPAEAPALPSPWSHPHHGSADGHEPAGPPTVVGAGPPPPVVYIPTGPPSAPPTAPPPPLPPQMPPPSAPVVIAQPRGASRGGAEDAGLADYPLPGSIPGGHLNGGIDLPTWDPEQPPPPSGPAAWLKRLMGLFGDDPLTAMILIPSSTLVLLGLLVALLRQC